MPGEGSESTQWNHANPVLEVSDVPRAIAYYRDVFGLTPSWMWEDRIGGVHACREAELAPGLLDRARGSGTGVAPLDTGRGGSASVLCRRDRQVLVDHLPASGATFEHAGAAGPGLGAFRGDAVKSPGDGEVTVRAHGQVGDVEVDPAGG